MLVGHESAFVHVPGQDPVEDRGAGQGGLPVHVRKSSQSQSRWLAHTETWAGARAWVHDTGQVILYRVQVGWLFRPRRDRGCSLARVIPGGETAGSPPAVGDGAAG